MFDSMVEQKEEIKKLIMLNDELENYFRNTIIPQLFVDADLILRKFTPPAMKQFKLTEGDIGKHIDEVSHRILFPTFMENIKEVIETGVDFEKEIQTNDLRWFQMNILPYKIYKENRTNGVIITFVNITERIKNLLEIEKLNADHETFIYSVSHDVKGPIGNLESLLDIWLKLEDKRSKDALKVIDLIVNSVKNLKEIVGELADVTKTRHDVSNNGEAINFDNILEDVKLTLYDKINKSHTKVTKEFNVHEIKFVKKNIRSIFYNLLSNAIKYKSPNRPPEIIFKTEQLEGFIQLSIADNGMGIAQDKLKSIFSEFSRVSHDVEGTGIGLYIVSKMIENTGGKIEVESKIGQGTTFKILFKSLP